MQNLEIDRRKLDSEVKLILKEIAKKAAQAAAQWAISEDRVSKCGN